MPIEFKWHVEDFIYEIYAFGDLNAEDVKELHDMELTLLENTTAPVLHGILNFSDATSRPLQLLELSRIFDMERIRHTQHRRGWMILIGINNPVQHFVTAAVTRLLRLRFRQANDIEDALAFLYSMSMPENISEKIKAG